MYSPPPLCSRASSYRALSVQMRMPRALLSSHRATLRANATVVLLDGGAISCRRHWQRRRRIGLQRCRPMPRDAVVSAAPGASPDGHSDTPSVGIDLGTSHSAIAVAPGGKPQLIRLLPEHAARPFVSGGDSSASRAGVLLPSVVFYPPPPGEGDGGEGGGGGDIKPLVGTAALVAAAKTAAAEKKMNNESCNNLVRSSKRLMGKKKKKKNNTGDDNNTTGDDNDGGGGSPWEVITVPSREEPLLPQDVAKEIIGALLDAAEAHFGGGKQNRPRRAVVSVPAYFDKDARAATEAAAVAAGLDEGVRLVREPVAAALGYGLRPGAPRDETVLVVDLGGGTFDVSLLEVGAGAVEVLSTGGDAALGGDDWDAALAEEIGERFLSPAGIADWRRGGGGAGGEGKGNSKNRTFSSGNSAWQALLGAARAAKEALSAAPAVELTLSADADANDDEKGDDCDKKGNKKVTARVTRAMLDDVGAPLFARAAAAIDEACYQSGVELGESVARWRESVARAGREREQRAAEASSSSSTSSSSSSPSSPFKLRPKRRPPVSRVLLVGGGTRMWGFDTFVENLTGLSPTKVSGAGGKEEASAASSMSTASLDVVDPDTSVAAGAALQAAMLDGDPALSGVVVLDVWQAGLARALAEARLAAAAANEEEEVEGRGEEDDDNSDDDDDDIAFSPAPPPPSKTKLKKQRARDAKRSLRSKNREAGA